jgi:hypothetical protein
MAAATIAQIAGCVAVANLTSAGNPTDITVTNSGAQPVTVFATYKNRPLNATLAPGQTHTFTFANNVREGDLSDFGITAG